MIGQIAGVADQVASAAVIAVVSQVVVLHVAVNAHEGHVHLKVQEIVSRGISELLPHIERLSRV